MPSRAGASIVPMIAAQQQAEQMRKTLRDIERLSEVMEKRKLIELMAKHQPIEGMSIRHPCSCGQWVDEDYADHIVDVLWG